MAMTKRQPWEFTCKTCGAHELSVRRTWITLAGPESETWQEWGPLKRDHRWTFEFKEMVGQEEKDEIERGDFDEFAEDDSDSGPENYETFEPESDPESDEFYVNCAGCDREIEFGWEKPNRGGGIFPVECSDFIAGEIWPEPRYSERWLQKHMLPVSNPQGSNVRYEHD
jgi:hypothetical protein